MPPPTPSTLKKSDKNNQFRPGLGHGGQARANRAAEHMQDMHRTAPSSHTRARASLHRQPTRTAALPPKPSITNSQDNFKQCTPRAPPSRLPPSIDQWWYTSARRGQAVCASHLQRARRGLCTFESAAQTPRIKHEGQKRRTASAYTNRRHKREKQDIKSQSKRFALNPKQDIKSQSKLESATSHLEGRLHRWRL
jgi:hypothetical protein